MNRLQDAKIQLRNLVDSLADDVFEASDEELYELMAKSGLDAQVASTWFDEQLAAGCKRAKKHELQEARDRLNMRHSVPNRRNVLRSVEQAKQRIRKLAQRNGAASDGLTLAARQGTESLSEMSDGEILSLADDLDELARQTDETDDRPHED